MNCKSCYQTFEGNFCNHCGQMAIYDNRISFSNIKHDIINSFVNFHLKFFKTFYHMFINPELVISKYLSGNRIAYLNPFRFSLITTILLIAFVQLSLKFYTIKSTDKIIIDFNQLEYANYFIIITCVIYAISFYLFFRKKINFAESFVISFYAISVKHILLFMLIPIMYIYQNAYVFVIFLLIVIGYLAYVLYKLKLTKNYFIAYGCAFLCFILFQFFQNIYKNLIEFFL